MTTTRIKHCIAGFALLTLTTAPVAPALAADWAYLLDGSTHFAIADANQDRLIAACSDNEIVVLYTVPSDQLAKEVAGLETAYIVFTFDEDTNGKGRSASFSVKPIVFGDETEFKFWGQGAVQMARDFGHAKRNIIAGITAEKPGASYLKYNATEFPVEGSSAAIRALFAGCGKQY